MCLIQELCLYIYNFKKYAKKSNGLLPLLYTNVVLSFAMLLQFRETDLRVHEVTPELPPCPPVLGNYFSTHQQCCTEQTKNHSVLSLSLTTFILTLYNYITPKPFPWERFAEHSQFSVQRLVGSLN